MPETAPSPEPSLKVFCCFTPAHGILYDKYFRPSVSSAFTVIPYTIELEGRGDFYSKEFLECIRTKVKLIGDSIRENMGEILIWSDVDILFFGADPTEIKEALGNYDIVFQRETKTTREVNTGFFACHCNDRTLQFFKRVEEGLSLNPDINEQSVINSLLISPDIGLNWNTLPMSYYARTHGWPPPAKLSIYHANYTMGKGGIERKIQQFQDVRFLRSCGLVSYCLSILKFGFAKLGRMVNGRIRTT